MRLNLLNTFGRWAGIICVLTSIVCVIAVVGARLPDAEVCVLTYEYSTTQPGNYGNSIYDTTRGQYTRETRIPNFVGSIPSPDQAYFIFFKPVRHETEVFDIYLQPADFAIHPRLLQPAAWISSGSLQGVGDKVRWSHDSKQVVLLWSDRDKNVQLTVANIDDSQIKTVSPFAKDPSKIFYSYLQEWSADNRYFTVIEKELNDTYYSFWDNITIEKLSYPLSTTSMVRGVWSPQGHTFASILRDDRQKPTDLMIFNPDTSSAVIKIPLPQVDIQHLMWSPDSSALVIGYLSCKEANCQQQWHYDLFHANGDAIASDLIGTLQNTSSTISNTIFNPEGRTTLSGYSFDATWSADGKQFLYLEQMRGDANHIYHLKVVELTSGQTRLIAPYVVVPSINSFYHMTEDFSSSNRILEGIPYVPQSDQVIIPYNEDDKINVGLLKGAHDQPIILVRGADRIEPQSNSFGLGQPQYWLHDMRDTSPIMIQWATGQGTTYRVKLTTANSDGSNIHTFDDGWSAIDNISFIMNADKPMMGFTGKKDGHFNLYMINLETGEQTVVLENVQDSNDWVINLNPQQTLMAINPGSSTANKGPLYIRSVGDGSLIEIDPDANRYVAWSNDGEKLALTSGTPDGKQHFRVVSPNGTLISDHIVSNDSIHLFIPMRWSKCY